MKRKLIVISKQMHLLWGLAVVLQLSVKREVSKIFVDGLLWSGV